MIFLRQSTASQEVVLGYFVDSTDGNTEETGLTIANTDIKIWKSGATTLANKNSGGATHISNGVYYAVLDATDTDTVGGLVILVHVSGALAFRLEAHVLEEAVYDAFYAASALGYVANAPVNVAQFGGSNGTFASGRPEVNLSHIAGSAVSTTTAQLGVNVVQVSGDSTAADNIETAYDDTAGAVRWAGIVDQGTAQSATGTTLVLRAAAAFADDELIGATIQITGGTTGVGQSRLITDYVSATDTATVDAWTTTPSGTITYKIFGTAPSSGGSGLDAAGVRAAVGLASANLDTQLSGIQSDTDNIQTRIPAALVSGRMDSYVGAMAPNVMTAAAAAADLTTELQSGLATSSALSTLQTTANAIETDTQDIQSRLPASLNNGCIQADVQRINNVEVVGAGTSGDKWRA